MIKKTCKTFIAEIYMAGNYDLAKQTVRKYCLSGFCVSIEKVDYIYTMGEESGFVARVINYPRFERTSKEIKSRSMDLAQELLLDLHQGSCSVVFPDETVFITRRNKDKTNN